MKVNTKVKITGRNVILVPYKEEHVVKFHEWMQSEELRQLSSTPLMTLEEEYKVQQALNADESKCIFIILDKSIFDNDNNEVGAMVGETDIYLFDPESSSAEINIMMVDSSSKAKKMGWEALCTTLLYGIQHLDIQSFKSRTSLADELNLSFFTRLTFQEVPTCHIFDEVTYERVIDEEWTAWLSHDNPFELEMLE